MIAGSKITLKKKNQFRIGYFKCPQTIANNRIEEQEVTLTYTHTKNMIADPLTKPIARVGFHKHVKFMG